MKDVLKTIIVLDCATGQAAFYLFPAKTELDIEFVKEFLYNNLGYNEDEISYMVTNGLPQVYARSCNADGTFVE